MDPAQGQRRVPQEVKALLERDGVVGEALARGIVNHRALARWIIGTLELDATEEAVLSALRRIRRTDSGDPFAEAHAIVSHSHLNIRSSVCQLTVPRTKAMQEKLSQIFRLIDFEKGEILYYTQGESGIKILVDKENLRAVQDLLGAAAQTVTEDLAAVSVVEPAEGLHVSGILALLSQTLALVDINVVDAVFGFPEYLFFVREEDTLRAYQALDTLIKTSRHRDPRPGRARKAGAQRARA